MKVEIDDKLITALRAHYRGCMPTPSTVADMLEAIAWQHLALNEQTTARLAPYQRSAA